MTCYYFYYDVRSMRLSYTNAGFPALDLFRIEKNEFDTLDTEGIPGIWPDASYGSGSTDMLRGDIGIIYSRSLINSRNQQGEEFGLLRLRDIIKHNRSRRPSEISQALHGAWEKFMGLSSAETDILALIFKIG